MGRIQTVFRRSDDLYGGHDDPQAFYIPPSSQRPKTAVKGRNDGDHVIGYNLMVNFALGFKGEKIKTLPNRLREIALSIFPDKELEINHLTENLEREIDQNRAVRKNTTAIMRRSNLEEEVVAPMIASTKKALIENQQRNIQISAELIAGEFIKLFNIMPNHAFDKDRKKGVLLKSKQKPAGRERVVIDYLDAFDQFLARKIELGEKGKFSANDELIVEKGGDLRFFFDVRVKRYEKDNSKHRDELVKAINELTKNKDQILDHVSDNIFDLYDYPKTGKKDQDDVKVLYETLPRLVIFVFTAFSNLKTLSLEDKTKIYDKFLDKILEKQCWDQHKVRDESENEVNLSREILKAKINEVATLDFEHNVYSMNRTQNLALPDQTQEPSTPTNRSSIRELASSTFSSQESLGLKFSTMSVGGDEAREMQRRFDERMKEEIKLKDNIQEKPQAEIKKPSTKPTKSSKSRLQHEGSKQK